MENGLFVVVEILKLQIFDTQADAKAYATQIAKKKESDIYIQNKRGQFHQANSYGKDKCPPKDKNY